MSYSYAGWHETNEDVVDNLARVRYQVGIRNFCLGITNTTSVNERDKASFPVQQRLMDNAKVGFFPGKFIIFVHGAGKRQLRWYCVHWKRPRDPILSQFTPSHLLRQGYILISISHVHLVYCVIYYLHSINKHSVSISRFNQVRSSG